MAELPDSGGQPAHCRALRRVRRTLCAPRLRRRATRHRELPGASRRTERTIRLLRPPPKQSRRRTRNGMHLTEKRRVLNAAGEALDLAFDLNELTKTPKHQKTTSPPLARPLTWLLNFNQKTKTPQNHLAAPGESRALAFDLNELTKTPKHQKTTSPPLARPLTWLLNFNQKTKTPKHQKTTSPP